MRTSCNGCRVLRKGCSNECEIRPCIEWIKSPESQGNATLFLAKFYGRAGLLNLINAGAPHQRPGIFKSLLYEACGRIVNPAYGSVGLLASGNWAQCQAAVDAVLACLPIVENNVTLPYLSTNPASSSVTTCDIRHVSKENSLAMSNQTRFKRSRTRSKINIGSINGEEWGHVNQFGQFRGRANRRKPDPVDDDDVSLELTLGFGLEKSKAKAGLLPKKKKSKSGIINHRVGFLTSGG